MQGSSSGPNATLQSDEINRQYSEALEEHNIDVNRTQRCDQSKFKTGNLSTTSATSVYVSDAHWVAILDNISELKEQVQFERDIAPVELHSQGKDEKESPALLFGYQGSISKEALLAAMPERPVVDRLVSKYFNDLDTMPPNFGSPSTYPEPSAASPEASSSRPIYLQQVVQCLTFSDYSRGGPHVIETLVHYHMIEHLRRTDTEIDVWLLLGVMLRLALRMGYHRDPSHFQTLTPFQDTRPPLNLFDHDFDETCSELPQPRNDNEITPMFYILARNKMAKAMGVVMDVINATEHNDSEIEGAEKLLQDTYDSLPPILKLATGFNTLADSPRTMLHRFVLATTMHCAQIALHQRCMSTPEEIDVTRPNRSLDTLLEAALKILAYQHIMDTETQPGGRLWSAGWKFWSTLTHEFLLATTVLSKALFSTLGPHPLVQAESTTANECS
ncbi:hypothetical protein SAPIO_CDS6126 [Scedosporium apiospermum]|uniref:Transcription factor domain-containing protein n=1 Tax=Pseudallescheria apiosperma TaxID=563466 RepID=A0A084G4K5_PSEDA|nr:uncharacterized protein SAPIO_CDS6126 [Scedosporium apiospermum]KEZ42267.1 hypothetical protein SAPIO_CDS6126 [Scedosporium apiospermum]